MLHFIYNHLITREHKAAVKLNYYRTLKLFSDALFSYDRVDLKNALSELGITSGDTLFVHASFKPLNGFQGTPLEIVACFLEAIGRNGNLLMPSMPYASSTFDYLGRKEIFDVKKTPSKMGLLAELFRRKQGVLRSLNPAHPVLACGKDAAWIVEGHEHCMHSCGRNSPFDKFKALGGKTLFYDVPFTTYTFIHHIEDLVKEKLPFPLYGPEAMPATVIDYNGKEKTVTALAFSATAVRARRPAILEKCLIQRNMLKKARIGRTALMLVSAQDAVRCAVDMIDRNMIMYRVDDHER
jgi:aminoglycoside 3-N-acetyltransferase